MAESLIKWKQADYLRLGKAISDFNKKRNKLLNEENENYFPDEFNYYEAKKNITTRRELNRFIKMLSRFQEEDAAELYINKVGEKMTKWTRKELGILARTVARRTNQEIKELYTPKSGEKFSKAQRGSGDLRIAEWKIRQTKQIDFKKGYEFKKLKSFISYQGVSDFYTKRAINYQRIYMEVIERYQNYDNYEKLMKKLKQIKNPNAFYDLIKSTNNIIDISVKTQYYTQMSQPEFDLFVKRITGEELSENDMLLNEFEEFKYYNENGEEQTIYF